jgi:drug/metabolite transporter (DMT)-like permease
MNRGDVLTLACAVSYAFHLMIVGYFSQREHFESVALGQVIGVALLAWASLLFEPPKASWNPRLAMAIVGTGLFATAFTFALQTYGQQYTTSTRAALIFALEPVFSLLTAISFGGEPLTRYSVVGGCLILGGILVVELKSRPLAPA